MSKLTPALTNEQIQKNIDTYNRLNPPSPLRDAQEARINMLYDLITMTPQEYISNRTPEEIKAMVMLLRELDSNNGNLPTHYKE
ncbi:TPA: hypothetical protein SIA39_004152 [Aeromonas sobria]|nr:hypothetical protein [Aeromonas sobria]